MHRDRRLVTLEDAAGSSQKRRLRFVNAAINADGDAIEKELRREDEYQIVVMIIESNRASGWDMNDLDATRNPDLYEAS